MNPCRQLPCKGSPQPAAAPKLVDQDGFSPPLLFEHPPASACLEGFLARCSHFRSVLLTAALKICGGLPPAALFTPALPPQFQSGTPPIRPVQEQGNPLFYSLLLRAGRDLVSLVARFEGSNAKTPGLLAHSGGSVFLEPWIRSLFGVNRLHSECNWSYWAAHTSLFP